MYKGVKVAKLGKKKAHRVSLKRNLLRSLLEKGYVETTTPKAKVLKKDADSLLQKAKNAEKVTTRRELQTILGKTELVKKLVEYAKGEKTGVSILKIRFRDGDNTEMSKVSLVGFAKKDKKKADTKVEKKEEKTTKTVEQEKPRRTGLFGQDKKVDTTTVIKSTERSRTRTGL